MPCPQRHWDLSLRLQPGGTLRYPVVPCGIALLRLSWAVSGLALLHVPQM